MANTTSQSYTFDKTLPIDEIVEESYERIGIINVSGYQLKTAKRSLNLLFSEWSNRGLHYWEVANQGFTLVEGTNVYTTYRSPADGASNGLTTTLSAGINDICYRYSFDRSQRYAWRGSKEEELLPLGF